MRVWRRRPTGPSGKGRDDKPGMPRPGVQLVVVRHAQVSVECGSASCTSECGVWLSVTHSGPCLDHQPRPPAHCLGPVDRVRIGYDIGYDRVLYGKWDTTGSVLNTTGSYRSGGGELCS